MVDFLNSLIEGIQAMTGATRPGIVILMLMGGILQKLSFGTATSAPSSSSNFKAK